MVKDPTSYISKLLKNLAKVNVLKLALYIERDLKNLNVDAALEKISFVIALVKGVLRQEDPHVPQVRMILNEALTELKEKVPEDQYNKVKTEVYRLGTAMHVVSELDKVVKDYKPKVLGSS
jgi:hypothetical protein